MTQPTAAAPVRAPRAGTLRPSADVAGDGDELRRRIAADGYLFLPGLLDTTSVGAAARDVLMTLQARGWLTADRDPSRATPVAPLPEIYGSEWREAYVAVHGLESLHRLGFDPGLQACLTALMGPDTFVLPRRIVRLIGPAGAGGPAVGARPHRDYQGFMIPDMLVSWIPLVSCPPRRGGLWVCRGSHRDGMAPCPPFDTTGSPWQTADYEPGDALILHCYCVHATEPNTSDAFRLSIDFRWQRGVHPVPRSMLDSDVNLSWSGLTNAWSTRRWISVPDDVTVTDEERDWEDVRDCPPSELFALRRRSWRVIPRRARGSSMPR